MNNLVCLPWYDLPNSSSKLDLFWQTLRISLRAAGFHNLPAELSRDHPYEVQWQQEHLLLSQCCGPDLFKPVAKNLLPIGRPAFCDLSCKPGFYYSYIVSRCNGLPKLIHPVVNSISSRSGCGALLEWLEESEIQSDAFQVSGSHQNSVDLLQAGSASLAAIDAHSWPILSNTKGLNIVAQTKTAPTPAFVTHKARVGSGNSESLQENLFSALEEAIRQNGEKMLNIDRLLPAARDTYQAYML
ncbi:hypothetical protein AB833_23160 [Chromatiales bacterium (ex Bugula neritina AB1)]|nr:hypothetical protein AB833_23160 [Chromatiales bacterium (ex Bugula neritina AB1)]